MYTYNISKNLCAILGTEFEENPECSDQILNQLPDDAVKTAHLAYSSLGTIAAAAVNTGKKRPEHSKLMQKYYEEGKINPPETGRFKAGHEFSEETKAKIGKTSGEARLGKKRGQYKILNRKVEECRNCGKTISGAGNIRVHYGKCKT